MLDLALNNLQEAGLVDKDITPEKMEWVRQLVNIYSVQMSYTKQIVDFSHIFFEDKQALTEEEVEEIKNDEGRVVIEEFRKQLNLVPRYTAVQVMNAIQATRKVTGVKGRKLFMPIRIAATGSMVGPGIGEAIELMGKDKVEHNIDLTLSEMTKQGL